MATLEAEEQTDISTVWTRRTFWAKLKDPQRDIVRSISLQGAGIRETAARLEMSEVAFGFPFIGL